MKKLPKPIDQYGSWEELAHDYKLTDRYLSVPTVYRVDDLNKVKQVWEAKLAARAEREGATQVDMTAKANAVMRRALEFVGGKGIGTSIIEGLLPENNTQAAIDASMFAMGPEALAGKMAYRILIPTVAGAVGGATRGEPGLGALQGATEATGGEALMGAARGGAYFAREHVLPSRDFARLSGWLESRFGRKIPNMTEFRRLFKEGNIVNESQTAYDKVHAKVGKKLGSGFKFMVPVNPQSGQFVPQGQLGSLNVNMRFDEAVAELHRLENLGYSLRGNPIMSHAGAAARDIAHEAEGEMAQQIDAVDRKLGSEWYTAHGRLKEAKAMRNLFTQEGVVTDKGPNFSLLHDLVDNDAPTSHKYDLIQSMGDQSMGPQSYESFRDMLMRGEPVGGLHDRPAVPFFNSKNISMSSHRGLFAHFNIPWPARHVGDVPFQIGKGRALRALTTLGPATIVQNLTEMTAPNPTPKGAPTTLPPTSITTATAGSDPRAPSVVPGSVTSGGVPAPELTPNLVPAR